MKGIDVSSWQENIDWQAVVESGAEFCIVKLGEGQQLDESFVEHINGAVAAGLKVGVYYYTRATTEEDIQTDANWVDEQIKTYLNGQTPEMGIWLDMEAQKIADSGADITALCNVFTQKLKDTGYTFVGVYSYYNWLTGGFIDPDGLGATPIWCAQYNYECNLDHPNLKMWQYTDKLSISGQNFDGNEFYE